MPTSDADAQRWNQSARDIRAFLDRELAAVPLLKNARERAKALQPLLEP